MVEMSGHEQLNAVTAAAEACVLANRTDLIRPAIEQAWWNGQAAATTWLANFIAAERTPPAAASPTAAARRATPSPMSASNFGGPTPAQHDAVTAAAEKWLGQANKRGA